MKPSEAYTASLLLNLILLAILCYLAVSAAGLGTPDQLVRDQLLRMEYPAEDYEGYLSSVDAGLVMSYESYLHKKYPAELIDEPTRGHPVHLLHIREVSLGELGDRKNTAELLELTDHDLSRYPLIGTLFVADVPFPFVQAYPYELAALEQFTKADTFVVWHNTTYRLWSQEI